MIFSNEIGAAYLFPSQYVDPVLKLNLPSAEGFFKDSGLLIEFLVSPNIKFNRKLVFRYYTSAKTKVTNCVELKWYSRSEQQWVVRTQSHTRSKDYRKIAAEKKHARLNTIGPFTFKITLNDYSIFSKKIDKPYGMIFFFDIFAMY